MKAAAAGVSSSSSNALLVAEPWVELADRNTDDWVSAEGRTTLVRDGAITGRTGTARGDSGAFRPASGIRWRTADVGRGDSGVALARLAIEEDEAMTRADGTPAERGLATMERGAADTEEVATFDEAAIGLTGVAVGDTIDSSKSSS